MAWPKYAGKIGGRRFAEKYGPFDRAWGLSLKNHHGGKVLSRHNPKHVSEMHLKSPHVIAKRLRTGEPLVPKRRDDV